MVSADISDVGRTEGAWLLSERMDSFIGGDGWRFKRELAVGS